MNLVPTRGATEPAQSWSRAPAAAFALRVVAHALPVVVAWLAVRVTASFYWRPDGWFGLVAWLAQAIVVSGGVSWAVDRVSRRLLPLAALLNLSLAFPDHAPSRFGMALRAGSTRNLQDRLAELHRDGLGDDLQQALANALELVTAVARHDRRTRGHTERVRAYADLIGRELGLTDDERLHLAWGVLLHDVGKLTVPPEILNKDTPLTAEEWEVLRGHPGAGRDIVAPLAGWLGDWVLAAADHHERWDGEGYPAGKAGADISLAGRITAVADAYDVITSTRSYKQPMSAVAARHELVRCSGTQFDPAVVRAFLSASFGRRWNGGPLAWLVELPSLSRLTSAMANSAATMTAAAATLVASMSGFVGVIDQAPHQLAMAAADAAPTSVPSDPDVATTAALARIDPGPSPAGTDPDPATTATAPATTAALTPVPTGAPATTPPPTTTPRSTTAATAARVTTTTAKAATTTARSATTTAAAGPYTGYLSTAGSGNTKSTSLLPLRSSAPTAGNLANYDTDRDSTPGLKLKSVGGGLGNSSSQSHQDWWMLTGARTLAGPATVTLHLSDAGLKGGMAIGVTVGLYTCVAWSCTLLSSGSWTGTSQAGTFVAATVNVGSVNTSMSVLSYLKVRVVDSGTSADEDVAVAYGTSGYPAAVHIG